MEIAAVPGEKGKYTYFLKIINAQSNGITISLLWWQQFHETLFQFTQTYVNIPSSSQWIIRAGMPHLQKDGIDGDTEILVVSEIIVDFSAVNLHLSPCLSYQ